MFSDIQWPYESDATVECPGCGTESKQDAKVHWFWDDSELELRCRKCCHQWRLKNVDWILTGKQFVEGKRVEPYPEKVRDDANSLPDLLANPVR